MRLRNKKTGEVKSFAVVVVNGYADNDTLAELNEEWEDYEEPKEFYFITESGEVYSTIEYDDVGLYKEIGNYFETKEQAEKVVEKLKAWKRLKDKGFKFCGMGGLVNEIYFEANAPFTHIMVDEYTADKTEKEYIDDLMLLFGDEDYEK